MMNFFFKKRFNLFDVIFFYAAYFMFVTYSLPAWAYILNVFVVAIVSAAIEVRMESKNESLY